MSEAKLLLWKKGRVVPACCVWLDVDREVEAEPPTTMVRNMESFYLWEFGCGFGWLGAPQSGGQTSIRSMAPYMSYIPLVSPGVAEGSIGCVCVVEEVVVVDSWPSPPPRSREWASRSSPPRRVYDEEAEEEEWPPPLLLLRWMRGSWPSRDLVFSEGTWAGEDSSSTASPSPHLSEIRT